MLSSERLKILKKDPMDITGREILELVTAVEKMREALIKVNAYFDCNECEVMSYQVCETHLDTRMSAAKKVLTELFGDTSTKGENTNAE